MGVLNFYDFIEKHLVPYLFGCKKRFPISSMILNSSERFAIILLFYSKTVQKVQIHLLSSIETSGSPSIYLAQENIPQDMQFIKKWLSVRGSNLDVLI